MKLMTVAVTGLTVEGDRLRVRFTNPADPGIIFDMLAKDVPDELKVRKVYDIHLLEPESPTPNPKPAAIAIAADALQDTP